MGWPKPRLGFAKGACFACGKVTVLHVAGVGEPVIKDTGQSGRILEPDEEGKVWFIPLSEEV